MSTESAEVAKSISYLMGEVHALVIVSQMFTRLCPDARELLSLSTLAEDAGLASLGVHPVPDAARQGYESVFANIRKAAEGLAGMWRPTTGQ